MYITSLYPASFVILNFPFSYFILSTWVPKLMALSIISSHHKTDQININILQTFVCKLLKPAHLLLSTLRGILYIRPKITYMDFCAIYKIIYVCLYICWPMLTWIYQCECACVSSTGHVICKTLYRVYNSMISESMILSNSWALC